MRVCVIGSGIAGTLLAWRLSGYPGLTVDLVTGLPGADATASSGGGVRAFETHPVQRRLATESLAELLESPALLEQAHYTETGCTYLLEEHVGLAAAVAEVENLHPGSTEIVDGQDLRRRGWHGLPDGTVGVLEKRAGFIRPDDLRNAIVEYLAHGKRSNVIPGPVLGLVPHPDGSVSCRTPGDSSRYDVVVVAAGPWTPGLLAGSSLPAEPYRTKAIQVAVHKVDGALPTMFVDETSGLYGRPTAGGELLLGVDSNRWSVPPGSSRPIQHLADQAIRIAGDRLPHLRLLETARTVNAADCYADPPVLTLWSVLGSTHRLFTFTGGSGGSVKTALAASRTAASDLLGPLATGEDTRNTTSRTENKRMTITDRPSGSPPRYHTIGIGAGPSNLSLAALYKNVTTEKLALFDSRPVAGWHTPLLYPGVRMQTGWMKDLVSLVDPRHELTFLNYLVTSGRLYALINSQFDSLPRIEYERYLAWATEKLGVVNFSSRVETISITDEGFQVTVGGEPVAVSEHLVLGLGTRPVWPEYVRGLPRERAFIADELGARMPELEAHKAEPIAVVGGGQTGLECVLRLLGSGFTDIRWIGRNQWFRSIDDSPMANELYRPSHIEFLQGLNRGKRREMIVDSRYSGDAITPGGLRALYQANYDGLLTLGRFPVTLLPGRDVTSSEELTDGLLRLRCTTPETPEEHDVRHIVVAAGREHVQAPFDDDLRDRIDYDDDGEMLVEPDYSVRWKGMNGHKIYSFNASRYSHGLTNAGLTQLPVRAAMVLNSMFDREIYPISDELCAVQW
ncbi:FAD-dependent oxidoreductase [Kribbella sp. CA-293567]|uniref:FAD-dependent oxidoreductase n=1 Tax=Kribbella sp. CA-293567 TaxID=3002436 RepID=UPI0022DD0F23|nr:FAD-dependent oxidoreductase [Kribbella sp. CA-293567]WBQ02546.1 FAD-dependent oxidoreductase [Kribbella sp. CA-293567]